MTGSIRCSGAAATSLLALLAAACGSAKSSSAPYAAETSSALDSPTCAEARENGAAGVACPAGQTITAVTFASYGTPGGACGDFTVDASCDASTSFSVAEAACVGKSACSVDANNGVFGDPCFGTTKALALEVSCSGTVTPPPPLDAGSPVIGGGGGAGGTCSYDVSLAAAGGHNTSAFPTYDQAHFPANFGTSTWITQSGQTMTIDPTKMDLSQNPVTPGHVSGVDVHTLIPARPDLRWFAHLTPWFDRDDNGHIDIGLDVNTPAYVASMIADVKRRGFDGIIIDWYGKGHYTDTFVQLLKANLATRAQRDFTYLVMLDQGIAGLNEQVLEQQVNYVQSEYGTDPAYEKEGGKPILMFIGVDGKVGQAAMYTAKANTGNASVWASEGVDVSETWVDQTYDWAHADGNGVSATDRYNTGDLAGYYGAVAWVGTRKGFGAMMSGFNGMLTRSTAWSQGLYLPRDSGACQMAWAARTAAVIPPQITRMQWATWSDWEEGTSIEGGVENDAQVTASVSGSTVSWNVTTGTGDETTIDHYEIYAATAANPDAAVDLGAAPAGTHRFTLKGASCALGSGTAYRATVDAIGKPNIRDHLSAPVPFTAP